MANIKRLLNKKGWTGKELGQLELKDLALEYKHKWGNDTDYNRVLDPAEFQKMVNTLTDPEQIRIYGGYLSIHKWVRLYSASARNAILTATIFFYRLSDFIEQAYRGEELYKYISQLPAIMTQKDYEEFKAKQMEVYLKGGECETEDLDSNIFNLVERCINYYLNRLCEEPNKQNPLKAIRKKYIEQPVTSKVILSRWNEVTNRCYYTIEDGSGRRSDKMTEEDWESATHSADKHKNHIDKAKCIYNGGTKEEAETAILTVPVQKHTYEEPPEDLTKWDVIEQKLLLSFYPHSFDGENEYTEANFLASMKDFYEEFKELVDFALQDMDKKYFSNDKVQTAKLPIEEWFSTLISWRELYEMDFYGEREEAEATIQLYTKNERLLLNGLAILQPSIATKSALNKEFSRRIDENGHYIAPDITESFPQYSIQSFFADSDYYAENIETIQTAREQLRVCYYAASGFNAQIDLIADYYDIPDFKYLKLDIEIEQINESISAVNALIPLIYEQINDTYYDDPELKTRKLGVLKEIFTPIEVYNTIPEENIESAKELLKGFRAFKDSQDEFFTLMCIMPKKNSTID